MAYITRIKIQCARQQDWTGSDDLDFYVDDTYLGRVTIGSGESRDVEGSSMLFQNAFISAGQTISVYEDDFDPDDLIVSHAVSDDELHSGLHINDTASDCDYSFEFTFETGI